MQPAVLTSGRGTIRAMQPQIETMDVLSGNIAGDPAITQWVAIFQQ